MTDPMPDEMLTAPIRSPLDPLRQVSVEIVRWSGASSSLERDELTAEEPLDLRVAGASSQRSETLAVIMRTPGHDEELAAGFLYGEGLIHHPQELVGFAP